MDRTPVWLTGSGTFAWTSNIRGVTSDSFGTFEFGESRGGRETQKQGRFQLADIGSWCNPVICIVNGNIQPLSHSIFVQNSKNGQSTCTVSASGATISILNTERSTNVTKDSTSSSTLELSRTVTQRIDVSSGRLSASDEEISSLRSEFPGGSANTQSRDEANYSIKLGPAGGLGGIQNPEPNICRLPAFLAVALNPYRLYPFGAEKIDLGKIAREIEEPGSVSVSSRQGGDPLGYQLATDGVARVILGVRTTDLATPVKFTLLDSDGGRLARLTETLFSRPLVGITGSIQVTPTPLAGKAGVGTAAAVFIAPETLPNFKGGKNVSILVEQGRRVRRIELKLTAPPVLFVHGLWADDSSWNSWLGSFPITAFAGIGLVSYPNSVSFQSGVTQLTISSEIYKLLYLVREKGIVATQVNVVAHSMGGLVTRTYAKNKFYKRDDNFKAGDVNKLITIDTPHIGSELARRLWRHKDDPASLTVDRLGGLIGQQPAAAFWFEKLRRETGTKSPTLAQLAATKTVGKPIAGAVEALRPGSTGLEGLAGRDILPYEVVASWSDRLTGHEALINLILRAVGENETVDSLLTAKNDVIVSLPSQLGPLPLPPRRVFRGLIHTDPLDAFRLPSEGVLNSTDVINHVACRLLRRTDCLTDAPAVTTASAIDDFTLEGRSRVGAAAIEMSGPPPSGLQLNNLYQAQISSPSRTIEHFIYTIEQGSGTTMRAGELGQFIHIIPTSLKPINIGVLAAFSDNTYAIRFWTLQIDQVVKPTLVDIADEVIPLRSIGSKHQLQPVAYVERPDVDTLDITHLATYSVPSAGAGIVSASDTGQLTALKRGTAIVRVTWRTQSDTVTVVVGP